jgi:hypothetical protein
VADYTATITWGDGQASAGTVTADSLVAGQFDVTGTHSYSIAGQYPVAVTILDEGGAAATAQSTAAVAGAPLTLTGGPVSATEGAVFSGIVASFADSNPFSSAGDFTATITWGDGQTSVGTIAANPQAPGHFTISGSNTYADARLFSVRVTIADRAGATASASSLAIVADAALRAAGVDVQASAGQSVTGVVASFADAGPSPAASYTTTIFWGDGTTSDGNMQAASSGFTITGTHTYAVPGVFPLRVLISDPGKATAVAAATATITAPAPQTSAVAIQTTEGTPFTGPVASLTVPAWDHGPEDLAVSIDWGDGHTTPGTLVGTGAGTFDVVRTNTFSEDGTYVVIVTITDRSAAGFMISTMATVVDAALAAAPVSVNAIAGATFKGPVATFLDAKPSAAASDFTASISWGDGQTSVGTIVADPTTAGQFIVTGVNKYAAAGTFPIVVVISDVGGATTSAQETAEVRAAEGASFSASADISFSTVVATIAGAGPDAASDFTALIHWGDGHTTPGLLTPAPAGVDRFLVLGTSTYLSAGVYSVTVDIDSSSGFQARVTGTATVAPAPDAPLTALPGLPIAAERASALHAVVAAFQDSDPAGTPADFSGIIDWGDGTTSPGSIIAAPGVSGVFFVLGSHIYGNAGAVPVHVSIRDVGGSLVEGASVALVADAAPSAPGGSPPATAALSPPGQPGRVSGNQAALPAVASELAAPAFPIVGTLSVNALPDEGPSAAMIPATLVATDQPHASSILVVSAAWGGGDGWLKTDADQEDADDFWPWANDRPGLEAPRNRPQASAPVPPSDGEQVPAPPGPDPEGAGLVPFAEMVDEVFIHLGAGYGVGDLARIDAAMSAQTIGSAGAVWAGAALAVGAFGPATRRHRPSAPQRPGHRRAARHRN